MARGWALLSALAAARRRSGLGPVVDFRHHHLPTPVGRPPPGGLGRTGTAGPDWTFGAAPGNQPVDGAPVSHRSYFALPDPGSEPLKKSNACRGEGPNDLLEYIFRRKRIIISSPDSYYYRDHSGSRTGSPDTGMRRDEFFDIVSFYGKYCCEQCLYSTKFK